MTVEVVPLVQVAAFALLSLIAIAGALGMATTMSMFRSGVFLMASFIGVAGLFLLLLADLLSLLQVMMYIGGMLVMILFMVLFSNDPGGAMMTGMMELPPVEKFFSLGLDHSGDHPEGNDDGGASPHGEHDDRANDDGEDDPAGEDEGGEHQMGGMDMQEMSMTTPIKKPAALLATVIGTVLGGLVLFRPVWPQVRALPAQNSAEQIGQLLMGKYMVAFEGAGLLILLGIFAAVFVSRPAEHPDAEGRDDLRAAVDEAPAAVETDALEPAFDTLAQTQDEGGETDSDDDDGGAQVQPSEEEQTAS